MKRKNAIILGVVSLISLSLVSGILLANNSNLNLIKASAETEYTITLDNSSVTNIRDNTTHAYFDLVGQTGKTHVEYKIADCTIYSNYASDFTLGGSHVFTLSFVNSGFIQIRAFLSNTGTLTDCYMVGRVNGEANNHFYQEGWIDGEAGNYEINIYLNQYNTSWLNTLEIDQVIFKYMC